MLRSSDRPSPDCSVLIDLYNKVRLLWNQNAVWTRFYIISILEDLGDLPYVQARLYRNPSDFKQFLSYYMGSENAGIFADLLTVQLDIIDRMTRYLKEGNEAEALSEKQRGYQNADKMAAFLSFINPYWNRRRWQTMLRRYLDLTENEILLRLSGDYAGDILNYNNIRDQAAEMADSMAEGIYQNYPNKF